MSTSDTFGRFGWKVDTTKKSVKRNSRDIIYGIKCTKCDDPNHVGQIEYMYAHFQNYKTSINKIQSQIGRTMSLLISYCEQFVSY